MVGTLAKLGWPQKFMGHKRQAVYGSFDRAGRLCYRLGAEKLDCPSNREKMSKIAFKDVEYSQRFRGMTQKQIRAEVYRALETKLGPFTGAGEV